MVSRLSSVSSDEEWRPVLGYEGIYEASSQGRIRSIDRIFPTKVGTLTKRKGRILSIRHTPSGHAEVKLSKNCTPKTRLVHQLVCESFYGPRPKGMEVRHLNDIPSDNRVQNLRWGTRAENAHDRVRNGIEWQSNKTECPRGHPLSGENLAPWQLLKGRRECLACSRASARVNYYGKSGRKLDMKIESDYEFHKIMKGGEVA